MTDKSIMITGAGIAGLSAGCYAQMDGYRTQIFELHNIPGGLCTAWKRQGYVCDGCCQEPDVNVPPMFTKNAPLMFTKNVPGMFTKNVPPVFGQNVPRMFTRMYHLLRACPCCIQDRL